MTETLETPASKIVPRLKTKYADSIKGSLVVLEMPPRTPN